MHCRCIKPNPQSQPGSLDPNYVLEQLRAGGVLEAVRIACAGFPTRKPFRPFAMRYNILLASGRGAYHHLDPETLQVLQGSLHDVNLCCKDQIVLLHRVTTFSFARHNNITISFWLVARMFITFWTLRHCR